MPGTQRREYGRRPRVNSAVMWYGKRRQRKGSTMRILGCLTVAAALATVAGAADPVRVAVLDFEDQTGLKADASLGGQINTKALADKGLFVMGQQLLGAQGFTLIDRRDLVAQMEKLNLTDDGKPTPTKPSFLHAAQALRTDVVLKGAVQAFSVGKQAINQGGYKADFSTLSLRIGIEAIDAIDGSVIAMADGVAQEKVRQTENVQTVLGEEEALGLMQKAVATAIPKLQSALAKRAEEKKGRTIVKLNIKTSADPAMVEIDGILVGTSPLQGFEVYKGDHVLTVGKPGYRDITKRILFERDSAIEIPMMRTQLSAEELKEIVEKARVNMIIGDPGITVLPLQ